MAEETVMNYWARFGIDASGFLGGIQQAQGGFLAFYRDVTVSLNMTMQIFDQFLAYGKKFKDLADAAMEFQSQIDKLGVTTGMSSTELYKWSNVARYADSDISSLSVMLRKLSIGMAETGPAGDKARAMLDAMHVSTKNADGSMRDMSDIFPDIIEGMKGFKTAGEQNTVAMALFGRSYQELSGYMLMTKAELKGYFNDGWAPTDAQSQKLRDYEQSLKNLNTAETNLTNQGGIALSGSMTELAVAMNDAVSDGAPLLDFLKYLNSALEIMISDLDYASTGWSILQAVRYGRLGEVESLSAGLQAREAARKERQETRDLLEWVAAHPDLKKPLKHIFTVEGDTVNKLPAEIDKVTEAVKGLDDAATKATKSTAALWDSSSVVGAPGSEMQRFLQKEMEAGVDYQTALNNWAHGAPTNTTPNPDSLGQVGPSATTPKTASLPASDQAAAKSADTLTSKLKGAYDDQTANFLKFGNDMQTLTAAYWTNITGMQADALTAMSKSDAQFTRFVAENPTIKNIGVVVWTKDGADWDPTKNADFMQTMRINSVMSNIPTYVKPEFKINVLVKVDKKGGATATADATTTQVMRAGIGQ